MKNVNRLGLVFGVGTIAALSFSLAACGDDTTDGGSAGMATGGSSAGATTGGAGASTGGAAAGASTGGTATGGGGAATGGAGASTGGASGGGGAGGKAGAGGGGAGGAGGSSGGGAGGGGAGGGGGGPSADCTHWCSGTKGVIQTCAGKLSTNLTTEENCLKSCAKAQAADLTCWNMHLDNINVKGESKDMHCPHTTGTALCGAVPAP